MDSATNTRVDSCGRTLYGHNGGIWEWTSTDFEGLPGFETSEVYPGYSTDFFDGLHKVVVSAPPQPTPLLVNTFSPKSLTRYRCRCRRIRQLGGSYATISRLASRSSLRNFYQSKYPFAWGGARVAYDA